MRHWYNAHELLLYDAHSERIRAVPEARGATVPAWSPDGKRLLYVADNALWLLPSLSAKPVEIATPLYTQQQWPAYYGQIDWTAQFDWWAK
jgi:dipeptidyl aminopeptidase/acylaminoacyl peptidase